MKVPYSWLKEYVDIDITAEELQAKLFSCGFEVEELTYFGEGVEHVVVGKILSCEKHPDADRLTVRRDQRLSRRPRARRARRRKRKT